MSGPDPHGPLHVRRPQTQVPAGKGHFVSEAVPVPSFPGDDTVVPGEPVWTTYRHLDPVRAAALTAAVAAWPDTWVEGKGSSAEQIITIAERFEAWLDPKEADGTPD